MTTYRYTVSCPENGTIYDRGLTALQAMNEILSHDGYKWKFVRSSDGRLTLWHSDGSQNSTRGARHFVKTVASSMKPGLQGQRDIARQVITACWRGLPEAMEDAAYAKIEAEAMAAETEIE